MSTFFSRHRKVYFIFAIITIVALSASTLWYTFANVNATGGVSGTVTKAEILTVSVEQGTERSLHTRDENGNIAEPDYFTLDTGEENLGIDKRIVELNRETGNVTVELAFQGSFEKPEVMYVALLLDCSNSMDKNITGTSIKKLASMKDAVQDLINNILIDNGNPDTKLSIITFHQSATIQTFDSKKTKFWAGANTTDITAAQQIVNNLTSKSLSLGTNTQGAFHEAYKIFDDPVTKAEIAAIEATGQKVNRYVVLLSDGKPTVCYPPSQGGPYYLASDTTRTNLAKDNNNKNEAFLSYFTSGPYTYGKTNKNAALRRNADNSIVYTNNYDNAIFSGDGNTANGPNLVASAVYEAGLVKDMGITVYALGLDLGGDAEDTTEDGTSTLDLEKVQRAHDTMEGVKSDGTRVYYANSPDDLQQMRKQIFSQMQVYSGKASIQDIIGDQFEFAGFLNEYNNQNVNGILRYDEVTRTVYWEGKLTEALQTIRYNVKVKDSAPNGMLDTNESAVLNYTNPLSDEEHSMAFPKPYIHNAILTVSKEVYKADGTTRAAGNTADFNITISGVDPAKTRTVTRNYKDGDIRYFRFLSLDPNTRHQFTLEEINILQGYQFMQAKVGNKAYVQPLTDILSIGADERVDALYKNNQRDASISVAKTIQDKNGDWVENAHVPANEVFLAQFVVTNDGETPLKNITLTNRYALTSDTLALVSKQDVILSNENGTYTLADYASIVWPENFNGKLQPGEELIVRITIDGLDYETDYSDTITVTADPDITGSTGQVTDQDTAAAEPDPQPAEPTPTPTPYESIEGGMVVTVSLRGPDIAINKISNPPSGTHSAPTPVGKGETIVYTVSVKNTNRIDALSDIEITDDIPSGLTIDFDHITCRFGTADSTALQNVGVSVTQSGNRLTLTVNRLAANETMDLIIPCTVIIDAGAIQNTAFITKVAGNEINQASETTYHEVSTPKPTSVSNTITGVKSLTGKPLTSGMFSFIAVDNDSGETFTAVNGNDGSIAFPITYNAPGIYSYSVSEVVGGPGGGINYDNKTYHVIVTVTKQGDGTMKAETAYTDGKIVFQNQYTAKDTELALTAKKTLDGAALKAGMFNFAVKDATGQTVAAAVNEADGTVSFSPVHFSLPGTYTFTVIELHGNLNNVVYDNMEYAVTVTVTDDKNGSLTAAVQLPNGGILFKNHYTPTNPGDPAKPRTPDDPSPEPPPLSPSNDHTYIYDTENDYYKEYDRDGELTKRIKLPEKKEKFIYVSDSDNYMVVVDEEPIGFVVLTDGKTLLDVDLEEDLLPLSAPVIDPNPPSDTTRKTNPKTSDSNYTYMLLCAAFVLTGLWVGLRMRKLKQS